MNINKIFQKMAAEKGISTTEIRKEIQTAIDEGMKNPDPKVQEYWNKIPRARAINQRPKKLYYLQIKK